MPYFVTKTIKGRPYLYLQWSWREGGKVKTDNLYIAPIDPSTGEIILPDTKTPDDVYADIREAFLNGRNVTPPLSGNIALSRQLAKTDSVDKLPPDIGNATPQNNPTSPKPHSAITKNNARQTYKKPLTDDMPPIPDKFLPSQTGSKGGQDANKKPTRRPLGGDSSALTLHAAIFFDELNISPHSITLRHRKHEQILNDAGMNPDTAPAITIRHGIRHRVRLFRRQNVIVVKAPRRGKGAANGLRESFGRALALSKLRALEVQKPDAYQALTRHAQQAQKQTTTELRKYLLGTNGRRRRIKALAVKLFGKIDPVRKGRNGKVPAAQLGLSDYGNRSDWLEDTTLLLMEIERHKDGYGGVLNDTRSQLASAKASATTAKGQGFSLRKLAMGDRMSWGFRRQREIRRAEARVALQQIRVERLNSLREAFRL